MMLNQHKDAAVAWQHNQNGLNVRGNRLVTVPTADGKGCVTFDPDTGDSIVWAVPYSAKRVQLAYQRLKPRDPRPLLLPGTTWREFRDAAKQERVS